MSGFTKIAERPAEAEITPHPALEHAQRVNTAAAEGLALALGALSKKAAAGLSSVFTGAGLFAAYLLADKVMESPSGMQLGGLAIFGAFFLTLEFIRRR